MKMVSTLNFLIAGKYGKNRVHTIFLPIFFKKKLLTKKNRPEPHFIFRDSDLFTTVRTISIIVSFVGSKPIKIPASLAIGE